MNVIRRILRLIAHLESPLLDNGKHLVTRGGKDGAILALNPDTGEDIWRSEGPPDEAHYSSIITACHSDWRNP